MEYFVFAHAPDSRRNQNMIPSVHYPMKRF